jgi:hypothetical protein
MRLLKILLVLALPVVFIMGCSKMDPVQDIQDQNLTLKAAKGIDLNGPHFELNLVAKKDNWNENEFNNPDRHTIFIPRNTENWSIQLRTPNNLDLTSLPGIRIDMTQGTEFAVLDGSVFDGDKAEFQLGPGKYAVYVAMKGKKNVASAYIAGWLETLQTTTLEGVVTDELWYYQKLGEVTVTRKWTNITGLFTINDTEAGDLPFDPSLGTEQWIFDYMNWLGQQSITLGDGSVVTYTDLAYFWQLVNYGSQLIKVRFYPV